MSWKSASGVVSWYLLHYCFYGVPVLTQNIINDYFFRFNCSITDDASFYTYNTIECASRCISDNICEGFQANKVSSKSTMCVLFNTSSSIYVSDSSRKTYIKRDLDEKFHNCNEHFITNTENTSPMTEEITPTMKTIEKLSTPEPSTTSTTKPSSSTRNPTTTFPKEPLTAFTTGSSTTEPLTTSTTDSTTTGTTEIPTTSTTKTTNTSSIIPSTYATTELSITSTNTKKLVENNRETSASPLSTRDTTTVGNGITQGETAVALNEKKFSEQKENQVPTSQISETTVSTNIDKHYECSVNAAIYLDSKQEIWLFFDQHIQKYTSVNDLTTSNFQRENLADLFKDAPAQLEAGYFDGTNTILIKDQKVYTFDSFRGSSSTSHKSTNDYYGHSVPQNIDAVILNSADDTFLFSDDTVTRIQGKKESSFSFDNNGNKNYYKSKDHKNKPSKITAATKVNSTTHYFFSGKKISVFKEGTKDGKWEDIGSVSCDL
ncbi:uncharacterized protein [Mytilus edulis]|uniref:uncharacterized protein n=1 Tax=Mytilus edulis TaxID=6550 RepID=UPI0039EE0A10